MPLNVKRFCTSVLITLTFSVLIFAQTSADVMRERVAKAKAHIAVRNYGAAIYELENIRRETSDQTVHGVTNVLLVNSFLEQGDYKRAQDFLTALSKKPGASAIYFAAASQVVKGARNQMERYRLLGLAVADPKLPKDAVADVDKMRETLEKVIEQTKVLSKDQAQTSNAMALMEEATTARSGLARDDYDANRWKDETAAAREDLASSRSVVVNAVSEIPTMPTDTAAINNPPQPTVNPVQLPIALPVPNTSTNKTNIAENAQAKNLPVTETPPKEIEKTSQSPTNGPVNSTLPTRTRRTEEAEKPIAVQANKTAAPTETRIDASSPLAVGSLVGYATQKSNPVYPAAARNMRMTGVVKVDLMVDENGQVAEVQNTSGPAMLQRAAMDAVKKWKFKPFTRGGQATKATGFINFNFSL